MSHKILVSLSEGIFEKIKGFLEEQSIKLKLIQVEDGETLLERAKKELPDLIILEKEIPLLDGFATVLLLKSQEETREIPVVTICKGDFEEEKGKARDCGSDAILCYPFTREEFFEVLKKFIKGIERK